MPLSVYIDVRHRERNLLHFLCGNLKLWLFCFIFLQIHPAGSLPRLQITPTEDAPIHPQILCLSQHIQFMKTRNSADLSSSPLVWIEEHQKEIYFIHALHSFLPIVARYRNLKVIQQLLVSLPRQW